MMRAPDGYVAAAVGKSAFNCPVCGAYGVQTWSSVLLGFPNVITAAQMAANDEKKQALKSSLAISTSGTLQPRPPKPSVPDMLKFEVNERRSGESVFVSGQLTDAIVSQCPGCERRFVWVNGRIVWPQVSGAPPINPDAPPDIKADYQEAASIFYQSPRGAAALLRLVIQKLCIHLGEPGANINSDIASLVSKGLNRQVKDAMDAVRVIGNEAVHPLEMDLRDDKDTVSTLFGLVNYVIDEMISKPKKIAEIYSKIPDSKLRGIAVRDAKSILMEKNFLIHHSHSRGYGCRVRN